jgi:aminopeptidase N
MVELFSSKTGVPYPYEKYDQVFVEGFIFGGMENTSATTLTDLVLHDERAALDYSAEDLISHELAHQWWGNLVTCRDWSQAWLNEGFATYFEVVWKEHARGADEAWMLQQELKEQYFAEDAGVYRRPIVCRLYEEPIELFDAHLYQKGSWVVSMLRDSLGETLFWRALKTYLKEHAGRNAETDDLRRAVEKASGRNYERFFEQWIERAGYPELKASADWDEDAKEYALEIEQVQQGEDTPEAFDLSFEIALQVDGQWRTETVECSERSRTFVFRLASEPTAACIDPRDRVLKTLAFKRPVAQLERALADAPWAAARFEAAGALGKNGSPRAVKALMKALSDDAFWGVQAAAAAALGASRSDEALGALAKAMKSHDHPKTRRAVAGALGSFRDAKAARALERVVTEGDASYLVQGAAASALGRTRQPGALELLSEALGSRKKSWNEIVRCGVIAGLGELGTEHREAAVEVLLPWTGPRRFVRCQQAAARALGVIGRGDDSARERLEALLEEGEFRVKLQAAQSLGSLGDPRSAPALSRMSGTALDGRERRQAREALRRLGRGDEARAQRALDEADALKADNRKLKDRLARLEKRLDALEQG